ncbi:Central kinetochore subunit CHL4 [Cytospora mali]|uniref:Central kinetochore subunit CHL4 n=1 Tax=Cytospora mali TaxID=578113 RepID=A0A194UUG0_CYTMA|nr:Central kinetochore subunit CHL4 [Valsa mali var. pyri (nom. inval.)]
MARISIPTTARLPPTLRLDPSNTAVTKIINRLTRSSLLTLALDWLDDNNAPICAPFLRDPEDDDEDPADLYPPVSSLPELREVYADMQTRKGSKREVIDRILEGDWRHGLTLYQLSMADLQYLYDHPASQKWSAYRVVPLKTPSTQQAAEDEVPLKADLESLVVPRFHPSTFLQNLQAQVLPDVKAHYNFDRPKDMPLLLLRVFILDSPYNTNLATSTMGRDKTAASSDASRTIYIAFPDGSPHVYISKSQTIGTATAGETKSLRALVVEGIPKALSRPRQRYTLKPTSLTTRNMQELLHWRGSGRTNTAGGGWSIYADDKEKESPLDPVLPTPPLSEADEGGSGKKTGGEWALSRKRVMSPDTERAERRAKRARLLAQARFGDSARVDDGKGVERVDIVIDDLFPRKVDPAGNDAEAEEDGGDDTPRARPRAGASRRSTMDMAFDRAREQDDADGRAADDSEGEGESWRPSVKLTFHGSHVFAGIRQLVEAGIIDGEKMPGWLTGEEGVTIGAVRNGRIRGHKGSGI